jgi:hypothetical protein
MVAVKTIKISEIIATIILGVLWIYLFSTIIANL